MQLAEILTTFCGVFFVHLETQKWFQSLSFSKRNQFWTFDGSKTSETLCKVWGGGGSLAQQMVLQDQRIHVPERLYNSPDGGSNLTRNYSESVDIM